MEKVYKKESFSAEETFAIGKALAEQAKPGEVYCLYGDLGCGKTVFSQGFGAGLGVTEPISSPTFTILKEYDEGRMPFYHSMFTGLAVTMRWMRSVTTKQSTAMASV